MKKLILIAGLALGCIAASLPAQAQLRTSTVPFTCVSGVSAAPGAGAVIADTAGLASGDYEVYSTGYVGDTAAVGKGIILEHRNAANAATNNSFGVAGTPGQGQVYVPRLAVVASERLRAITGSAAGAVSSQYVASICYRKYQ